MRRSVDEDEERDEDEDEDDDDESSDYQIALQDLAASSQSLIAQVAQLAPHSPPDTKDLRNKLHASQTEVRCLWSCSICSAYVYVNRPTRYGLRCTHYVRASLMRKRSTKPCVLVYNLWKTGWSVRRVGRYKRLRESPLRQMVLRHRLCRSRKEVLWRYVPLMLT